MAKAPHYGAIAPDQPLRCLADTVLRVLWATAMERSADALRGDEPGAVHDMRVATRRFRTALRTFRDCYPKRERKRVRRAVRRLGRALGRVRDADVHVRALREAFHAASDDELNGIEFAIEQIAEERGRALAAFESILSRSDSNVLEDMLAHG